MRRVLAQDSHCREALEGPRLDSRCLLDCSSTYNYQGSHFHDLAPSPYKFSGNIIEGNRISLAINQYHSSDHSMQNTYSSKGTMLHSILKAGEFLNPAQAAETTVQSTLQCVFSPPPPQLVSDTMPLTHPEPGF